MPLLILGLIIVGGIGAVGYYNYTASQAEVNHAIAQATIINANAQANLLNAQAAEAHARAFGVIALAMAPTIIALLIGLLVLAVAIVRYKALVKLPPANITYNNQRYLTQNYFVMDSGTSQQYLPKARDYPLLEPGEHFEPLLIEQGKVEEFLAL